MDFVTDKDESMIPFVLSQILDSCVNGVTLSDPDEEDNPLVYANEAFELITGYSREEIIGRNCRFLQGDDRDQEGIEQIRQAVRENTSITLPGTRIVALRRACRDWPGLQQSQTLTTSRPFHVGMVVQQRLGRFEHFAQPLQFRVSQ